MGFLEFHKITHTLYGIGGRKRRLSSSCSLVYHIRPARCAYLKRVTSSFVLSILNFCSNFSYFLNSSSKFASDEGITLGKAFPARALCSEGGSQICSAILFGITPDTAVFSNARFISL